MKHTFLLSLALALSAQAWAKPASITTFTPQNLGETTNQIRAVFSEKMVSLGASPEANIFNISCQPQIQGVSRWEDEKSWTFDFRTKLYANKLPGGTRCTVTLKDDFKNEHKIAGKTAFTFQVDGPNVLSIYPGDTNGVSKAEIAEDQAFALGLDANVDEASVLKNVSFKVDGVASRVSVRIVSEAEKRVLMNATDFPKWRFNADTPVIIVRASERFPANKKVSLVWGAGVKSSESGLARQHELVLPFETRPMLTATFSCSRENAKADCSPFSELELNFSARIPADQAKQIELVSADGKTRIKAVIDPDEKGESTVSRVTFPALVQEKQTFKLSLPAGIRDDAGRALANQASFPLVVKTAEFPPLAKFAADFGLIEANQSPVLLPATLRNLEAQVIGLKLAPTAIEGSSLRLDGSNFAAVVGWLKKLDQKNAKARSLQDRDRSIFTAANKASGFKIPLKESGKAFEVVGIPLAGNGLHIVELQSKLLGKSLLGKDVSMFVPAGALVTNLVVHSKWGLENSLFWVTSLDGGTPVPGAQVVVHDCSGKAVWSAQTDAQGRAVYAGDIKSRVDLNACNSDFESEEESYSRYNSGFFVSARSGGDFTFTHTSWQDGIETWRFDSLADVNSPQWAAPSTLATTVLDRTLVRAGEAKPLGMKHFVRVPYSRGFKSLAAAQLPTTVQYEHLDSGAKYSQGIEWDASGTAVSSFSVPKDAKLGLYQISLIRGQESFTTSTFQVMEFKVPLMKGVIAFEPGQDRQVVQPGKLDAQVSVTYQDGGPAVNQPVTFRYSVERKNWVTFEDLGYRFNFGSEKVVEKQTRTDGGEEQIVKTVELPLRLNGKGSQVVTVPGLSGFDSPRVLRTQLEFTDKNSETQNVTRELTIYQAKRLVAVSADNSYGSARRVKFQAAVVDLKGQPIAGVAPKFELFENVTYTHRTRMVGGYYSSESFTSIRRVKDQSGFACAGQTDKRGLIACEVTAPESGNYIVQAAVSDADGNTAYGSDSVYVRGSRRAWFPADNNDRMDLIPEKKDLQAGETANLQVQMPFAEATVLVTIEREGVLESFVKQVSTTNPVIQVPIKPEYSPNVYVSAMAVRGRVTGSGSEATATVDLGKPAYKLGMTALNVNWAPNSLKVAVKPEKEVYKPREQASVSVAVTLPNGQAAANAEFAIAVIDEGLLQLAKNRSWDLLRSMMGRRSLNVETATAQMQVVGKRHYGMKARPTGGDGGQAPTRELFDTQVYWQARVKTDANGQAIVKFPMNDALTAFRVVAIAHSGLDRFGTGDAKITAQQDVLVIPSLGTVSRNGDKVAAEFTLRNTTKAGRSVTIGGRVKFTGADGSVTYSELPAKTVKLGPQGSELVSLADVEVPERVVKAEYELSVTGDNGERLDSIRIAQDVKPAVLPRTWMAQLSRVTPQLAPIGVNLPANALLDQGGVRVSLKRSLADGLDTVKDYYEAYPFESLESLASRAISLQSAEDWAKAMRKLPAHLDTVGLVKYYPGSGSVGSDTLTAYLLSLSVDAQTLYGKAFSVPEETLAKMVDGLQAFVQGKSGKRSGDDTPADIFIRRVNAIEVLARYGKADATSLTSLPKLAPEQIPTASLVDLLSIYVRLNVADRQVKLAEVVRALNSRLTRTGTGERLQDGLPRPWYAMTSSDSDQLQFILTLAMNPALRKSWAEHLPLLVSQAAVMMKRGSWDLTVANATGVLAFKAYTKYVEPENVTGETKVALDFVAANCSAGDAACRLFKWEEPGAEAGGVLNFGWPAAGEHKVDLAHAGTGLPWAIVAVNAAVPLVDKVESHIQVSKKLEPQKAVYQKGDVVTVTLEIKPQADIPFISVMDPIPAGAKILGGGLDNDSAESPVTSGWSWPDYQEITYDAYRASYSYVSPRGVSVVYRVQVNNAGTFRLPATRVEAVYMPENFAEVPNADWTVKP